MKLTKRKGFNFFRSYYDVYNELTTDKEKAQFIGALLDRQFLGIEPTDLKGMPRFAYISQTNSIDSQVKGYEDKLNVRLDGRPYIKDESTPMKGGKTTPTNGGKLTPCQQGKEEVQEEVQEEGKVEVETKVEDEEDKPYPDKSGVFNFDKYLIFINETLGKNHKIVNKKVRSAINARLKEGYTNKDISKAIVNIKKSEYHINSGFSYCTPEFFSRSETIDKYSKEVTVNNSLNKNSRTQHMHVEKKLTKKDWADPDNL